MSHSRCPLCRAHHWPRCRATGRRWPTEALYAMVPTRRPVTALSAGPMPETIDDATADRWAIKLGFHPEQVWPGWCEAALRPGDDLFVNGCDTAGPGWRQAWDWWESQRRDLPAGNPEVGPTPTRSVGSRERGQETAA